MKVLVTGGAGFIGSTLSKRLLQKGHDVLSLDLASSKTCESLIGDITDINDVYVAIKRCDCVFHLAAVANLDVARENPELAINVNVQGTYLIAKCCSQLDVPLNFASTACVYGNTVNHPSNEESVCVPTDIYGVTKLVGETIVKSFGAFNILRFGTTYGPGLREALAVHIFINQALNNEPLTIHGSGLQTRCMIYIDDLVEACVKLVEKNIRNETLNLATEEELSVLQVANIILEETGKPKGKFKFVEDRPGQIMKEQLSVAKARKLLGWKPKVYFKHGINLLLQRGVPFQERKLNM